MFKKLFGSKVASNPKPGPQICMPTLATETPPSAAAIIAAWKSLFPKHPPLNGADSQDQVYSFEADGMTVMVAAMPMPIPSGDIESACELSWMWEDAATEMKRQKSHFIITALHAKGMGADPVSEAMLVSRTAAAVCKASQAVGVYWGNGVQVHKPEFFIEAVQSFEEDDLLPCMLWVGQIVSGDSQEGPFTLSTVGLKHFGHKDIEVIDTSMHPGELRSTIYDLINYLLSNGPILKHCQTFGPSADIKWQVEHTTSKFRPGEPVIRLHIP